MIEFLKGLTQLHNLFYSVLCFVLILTVLVFVHEFGHYIIARWNRVRIEVFSIGFGPELFGWWDRAGTRWKFSAIPLGGYVKMFGDSDATSGLPAPGLSRLSEVERGVSFHYKRLGQRAAIVAAGPAANFIFAIVALAVLFMTYGQPFTPAEVGQVQPGSAAEQGGIHPGDVIVQIDGRAVHRFEDVQQTVRLNPSVPMTIVVRRDGQEQTLHVTPNRTELTDRFGNHYEIGLLGIARSGMEYVKRDPATAIGQAGAETWNLTAGTLQAMWQIIIGTRATDELGERLLKAVLSRCCGLWRFCR
jgi:regulator of sigma E protease